PSSPKPPLVGVGRDDLLRRPNMQLAALCIDDRCISRFDCLEYALDLADGGDAECARHDGDMTCRAPLLQHEAAQALTVIVEQLGRAQGAAAHDGVLWQAH